MDNFVYVILSEAKNLHEDAVFLRDSSPCLRRGQNDIVTLIVNHAGNGVSYAKELE